MIAKITMNGVASFKQPTSLETSMRINLIYGLNGTGKSTFSDFLYGRTDIDFSQCSIEPKINENTKILVYNRSFIHDNFYEPQTQKGIFSLSKENKIAQEKIEKAQGVIQQISQKIEELKKKKTDNQNDFDQQKNAAIDKIWEIKTNYTGGDRILDFCLDGLNRPKEKPFEYILKIDKPLERPPRTIEQIKADVQSLQSNDRPIPENLPEIIFSAARIEKDPIFQKIIVGNSASSIAELIQTLRNQNWVQEGLQYLDVQPQEEKRCPFCQQMTITKKFIDEISAFFSGEYEKDKKHIKDISTEYSLALKTIVNTPVTAFDNIELLHELKENFNSTLGKFYSIINNNMEQIIEKYKKPNIEIKLQDSAQSLQAVNEIIALARIKIQEFNKKLEKKKQSLQKLRHEFWQIQRWEYDQTISLYNKTLDVFSKKQKEFDQAIDILEREESEQKEIIKVEQQNCINIQDAVDHINSNLLEIGIDYLKIEPFEGNLYHISRSGQTDGVFKTLSEGEKMMISFLYFIELCHGKQNAEELDKKKIIVIDDPISSLSHIYVFNVGKLLEMEFLKNYNSFEQVFILTHSLYFFNELHKLCPRPKESDSEDVKNQKVPALIRLFKNNQSSFFEKISSNDITNDYHAYWAIVKDRNASPALIANAMRNIIEYFFGFIEKKDLNAVFQKPCLAENKFQAFCRYINVESHSRSHLIYDLKEFDYDIFREAFHLIFTESNYEDHYRKMMEE